MQRRCVALNGIKQVAVGVINVNAEGDSAAGGVDRVCGEVYPDQSIGGDEVVQGDAELVLGLFAHIVGVLVKGVVREEAGDEGGGCEDAGGYGVYVVERVGGECVDLDGIGGGVRYR